MKANTGKYYKPFKTLKWFVLSLMLLCALGLQACATRDKVVWHAFEFDGYFDGWAKQVDLLTYDYGGK